MAFSFKYFSALLMCLFASTIFGQVSINLSIKPPFTPFISDYTNPGRLDDISVALFNQSGDKLRLKFKLTLKNPAKGIDISIKENVNPNNPLELESNEFRFIVLEDVSNLYGKLNQNNFNISGADIQSLILDGTIPDGIYEVCLQAFDFDSPGFTKPLSSSSPSGCFSFQVNYTDPPTDIRFNNNLLQYSFGSEIPKIGVNGLIGQNYNIQFTAPAINIGSSYEYELMIFEQNVINPAQQRESSLLEAINTITPIIRKNSSIPFFTIDASDVELDFNKNYFMLIKVVDLNEKTLFKNKGFSTFKAFCMIDVQPILIPAVEFVNPTVGEIVSTREAMDAISWNIDMAELAQVIHRDDIEARIKIIRLHQSASIPDDIFSSNVGEVLLSRSIRHDTLAGNGILNTIATAGKFGNFAENSNTRWIIGVEYKVIPGRPFTSHIQFLNSGRSQTHVEFQNDAQTVPVGDYILKQTYPENNDTLPFHYPPLVYKLQNLGSNDKIVFTQFNSGLEPIESFKHIKLTTDAGVNTQLNQVQDIDTVLNLINKNLDEAARFQLNYGDDVPISGFIANASASLNDNNSRFRVQIKHAINGRNIPLGNSSNGKMALLNNIFKYHALAQYLSSAPNLDFPNIQKVLYIQPYRNNVQWTAKIGLFNTSNSTGLSISDYAYKFHTNGFTSEELRNAMLKTGLKTGSGSFNVGMKTPKLIGSQIVSVSNTSCTFSLSFLPSEKPKLLLPVVEKNETWKEFEFLSVAQQWNIEISRKRDFSKLDTVVSKKILKQYNINAGEGAIVADLYTKVDKQITVKDTGKYYWRVTWSNVSIDSNDSVDKRQYFANLGTVLANASILGVEFDVDSMFFIRKNYKYSRVDSFVYNKKTKPSAAQTPAFEVVYPVPGDTIPFLYPPVVIRKNPADTAYKLALTKFNSNLEPFSNYNYYLIDSNHTASKRLKQKSYDSMRGAFQSYFDKLAAQQLFDGSSANDANSNTIMSQFLNETAKRTHLQIFTTNSSGLFPLGNSAVGKLNLVNLVMTRYAGMANIQPDAVNAESPDFSGMLYLNPYKEVNWNAKVAYFYPNGTPKISIDSFENLFNQDLLTLNSPVSTENKLGQMSFNSSFHIGMRTPEIIEKMAGKKVPANKLEITFRPSIQPAKILPEIETSGAWKQWQSLFTAQQWNIEVSLNKNFDSLVYTKSKCLVEKYTVPGSKERIINDFYSIKKEKIDLPAGKKYYYRITWSNPTALDSNNSIHKNYFVQQKAIIQYQLEHSDDFDADASLSFLNLTRKNYKYSSIDSFELTDSVSTIDTAVCGLACRFNMTGVSTLPVAGVVKVNDVISVGQFSMKVKTIIENTSAKTYGGTGSITCSLLAGPIAVKFTDIQVNAQKRMIIGLVKAEYKSDAFISNLSGTTTGNSLLDKIRDKIVRNVSAINREVFNEFADTISDVVNGRTAEADQLNEIYDYLNSPLNLAFDILSGQDITLPFGLSKEVDNYPHTIAITDINFTPTEATFNAAAVLLIDLPNFRNYMGFGGSGLCLTPKGLADLSSGGSLELMGSVKIPMGEGYGFFTIMGRDLDTTGKFGNSGTRVLWDCSGFKGIDLKVAADISRVVAIPVVGKQRVAKRRLRALGHGMAASGGNWLLSLDLDTTYELTMLPGFTFSSRVVALDFSDLANPQGMEFPLDYQGDRSNTWRGLYVKELSIGLPYFLNEKDTLSNLSFAGRNAILDRTGFTGRFSVENILTIDNGTFGGWKYSLDNFGFAFVNNVPTNAGFSGKIRVPIFGGDLGYSALLTAQLANEKKGKKDSLGVNFSLNTISQLSFDAMFATVNLAPSSKIEILGNALEYKSLRIRTNFNGDIALGADNVAGMKDIRLGSLPFEGLKFKTAFFTLDSFEFKLDRLGGMDMNRLIANNQAPSGSTAPAPIISGVQKAGGFPISIKDFALNTIVGRSCIFDLDRSYNLPRIGIKFKLVVNVADAGGNAIGGSCGLGLYMALKPQNGGITAMPIGLDIDTINIDVKLSGAATIKGGIAFIANDPVYGNGIAGVVVATTPVLGVGVTGMFGEIGGMRYWMFGAKAQFPPIPIDFSANVIYANSFSGEFWYKMNRTSGDATASAAGFQLGKSPSGASFVPASNQLFGFGAALGLTGPPGSPLFGDVGLYAQINNQGGLSKLSIEGNLWMTQLDKATAQVLINGNTTIDVDNNKLIGKMTALVNVGGGAVRGRMDTTISGKTYYIAGSVDLLMDKRNDNWHIKLGNPFVAKGRMGFGFYAGTSLLFESGGYFMMGNKLPKQLPPMDAGLVTKIQQAGIVLPSSRAAEATTGFVVLGGVDATVPEKKVELGMFYAGLSVQFAMDGMLKPQTINCPARNGLSGWYMTGRAYAAINGALGLHVNTPFFQGDILAAELNAAMLLDAGLMNPYYFKGQFAANYSVLGGLVEGSKRFNFELAEDDRCKPAIAKSTVSFGNIVADVKPAKDATNVLVGVEPTIALNFALNKEDTFRGTKVLSDGKVVNVSERIRVKYDYIRLRDDGNLRNRRINIIPSDNGMDLAIRPDSFLRDGSTFHTLSARFFVERFNINTNVWEPYMRTRDKVWDTVFSVRFRTEAVATFQSDYVSYTTPLEGERYFKPGDYTTAKIVCNRTDVQTLFFTGTLAPSGSLREVQFINGYNVYYGLYARAGNPRDTVRVPLRFVRNEILFPLPSRLDTFGLFQFRIVKERIPGSGLANIPRTVYNPLGEVSIRTRTAADQVDRRLMMYSFVFKASKYRTIRDKISQLVLLNSAYTFPTVSDVNVIAKTNEPFEDYELKSSSYVLSSGNFTLPASMVLSCSNNAIDDNTWMTGFYRPKVWKAGDSLQRKRTTFTSTFNDRTRQLVGADILLDEHVFKRIPNSSLAFSFDLRMADTRIVQLQGQLLVAKRLELAGVSTSNFNLLIDNGLTLDPVSGTVSSSSSLTPNPYTVTTTTTSASTPTIGSLLNIEYSHFRLMTSDFTRLKSLASRIISSNTSWYMDLTPKERELVIRASKSAYTLKMPIVSERFAIALHPKGNNFAPVKKLYINSNILAPIAKTITTTYTSFSL